MHEYHFDLVGLHTVLKTPESVTISKSLQPFLCAPQDADCTISVQHCTTLPPMGDTGYWSGPDCYENNEKTFRIFHAHRVHGMPFAVTQLSKDGQVEILTLQEDLSCFADTAGIFNHIGMENLLLQNQGLLLHASLIEYVGKAIVFTGPSGIGKSTQAKLWQTCENATILNGDRAALRLADGNWIAYGSPYAGTSGIYRRGNAPLAAIVVLEQAEENSLQTLSAVQALRRIYPELSVHRWDCAFVQQATDLCLQMLSRTPVLLLKCRPDVSAVALLKKGLSL